MIHPPLDCRKSQIMQCNLNEFLQSLPIREYLVVYTSIVHCLSLKFKNIIISQQKNQTAALDCLTEYLFKLTEYYAMSTLLIESNSSRISFEGFCVSSETATFTASARKKPRTSE